MREEKVAAQELVAAGRCPHCTRKVIWVREWIWPWPFPSYGHYCKDCRGLVRRAGSRITRRAYGLAAELAERFGWKVRLEFGYVVQEIVREEVIRLTYALPGTFPPCGQITIAELEEYVRQKKRDEGLSSEEDAA